MDREKDPMLLSSYDYELPEDRIARNPVPGRETSRLLHLDRSADGPFHRKFSDLAGLLRPGDLLVVNDTRVVKGRLFGCKKTGGKVEVLIIDYAGGLRRAEKEGTFTASCLVRASKPSRPGTEIEFDGGFSATVLGGENGVYTLAFSCADPAAMLEAIGRVPLPPYITRGEEDPAGNHDQTYQTVYARAPGAVAAPTAGLHFTDSLLEKLAGSGVEVSSVTLHVGYGTFLPVRVEDVREHAMHSEWFEIPEQTALRVGAAQKERRRVVAVGTTVVRTLEYAAREHGRVVSGAGMCDLFIYPGFDFKVVDALVTNFHLPRSTLLMLVSALAGRERILDAYEKAKRENYRFYSYGDAMFIE